MAHFKVGGTEGFPAVDQKPLLEVRRRRRLFSKMLQQGIHLYFLPDLLKPETLTCLFVWWRSKLKGRSVHQLQSHEVSALIPISGLTKAERDAEKRKSMKLTDEDMTEIEKILAAIPCSG